MITHVQNYFLKTWDNSVSSHQSGSNINVGKTMPCSPSPSHHHFLLVGFQPFPKSVVYDIVLATELQVVTNRKVFLLEPWPQSPPRSGMFGEDRRIFLGGFVGFSMFVPKVFFLLVFCQFEPTMYYELPRFQIIYSMSTSCCNHLL